MSESLILPLAALAALLIDQCFGEPRHAHPLVGFGRLATWLDTHAPRRTRLTGLLAWGLAVLPWVALAAWLHHALSAQGWVLDVLLLAFAVGGKSLGEHAEAVRRPLHAGNLPEARQRAGDLVSRDTQALDHQGVARATVESVLENGNDALLGALFWFALLGGPGALLYRLANTLDAMWGYRTPTYCQFGWAAARLDDALNWPAARLTALAYALAGHPRQALLCWRRQAPAWDSPNAGPVMAAGAGSLGVCLGGAAIYHGVEESRPPLGSGRPPQADDITRAVSLLRRSVVIWWLTYFMIGVLRA